MGNFELIMQKLTTQGNILRMYIKILFKKLFIGNYRLKKICVLFLLFIPYFSFSQAHFGVTIEQLIKYHPDKIWVEGNTDSGVLFYRFEDETGERNYYVDDEKLVYMCDLVPKDQQQLNTLVNGFNKRYVIKSDTSWYKYLENGSIISIKLIYKKDIKANVFIYQQIK